MTSESPGAGEFLPLKPRVYLTLLLLAQRPRHGYDLLRVLEERSGGRLRLNPGSFYRLIHRLRDQGLIERVETSADAASGGADRKTYGLTELGLETLRAEARRQEALLDLARDWAL
ncbi:MAG: PadR family transcriptional regulator [Gemmatimonadetes bacterium]|nr:PadR family transcriptional regulator [Gemmatimonadota bacterium]NIR77115.1 PadR family transcriptional regulator [Gemmatimonadota bacterium]NIT85633.1 PadR family transcriptional regulator [Gemmatimonadota bacterium]NIU29465.1 PadR family transcriptional regulator [Gemmatimonadota bacterium]NIU34528.1 PadR family transcriptional regulator [Gemmatimonadota bacterium]